MAKSIEKSSTQQTTDARKDDGHIELRLRVEREYFESDPQYVSEMICGTVEAATKVLIGIVGDGQYDMDHFTVEHSSVTLQAVL